MDSYKEINRELILVNQELKVQQSIYQKQIIILKNQLMEELERRVVSEKMIRMMLIDNFKNALKLLDPENGLLELLEDNEDDKLQKRCQQKRQPTQILQELRRSNSLHRRSSIVASPTRRLIYPMKIVTPENHDDELRQQEENYEESKDSDNEVQDMSVEEALENCTDKFACIAEDVIQEEDENEEEQEKDDEYEELNAPNTATIVQDTLQPQQNMSITEEMSITEIEEDSLPTDSISQHVHEKEQFLENTPPPQVLIKNKRRNACYLRRSPLQDVSNFEGGVVNMNLEKQDSTKSQEHIPNPTNVVVKRGKRRSLFDNDSIQSVRHSSQRKGEHDEIEVEAISIGMNSFREPSSESGVTSMALSELTCGQFANAPSSTPNSSEWRDNSSDLSQTTQTRASRRCKPKCLTEPRLNSKLRNDETKTQQTRRNTKKKNKK